MRFLRNNKKKLNTVVFNKADFSVLNYEQLLKVNGAGGGGGGSSSGPSSGNSSSDSTSSSSGPSDSSSSSASDSPSGSSSGGKGAGQSAPSSYENDNTSASTGVYVENSNEGVANANPGDKIIRNDGTEVTLTQGDIDWAKKQINNNSSTSNNSSTNNNSTSGNNGLQNPTGENTRGTPTTGSTNKTDTTLDSIKQSINDNWDKQYNYDTGYRCDNWVEEVLDDAGKNSSDYLTAGKANEKTVQEHIDELSKKTEGVDYTKTLPTADGAYVVFMDNGTINGKSVGEHAAILIVENGKSTIYDNSSGNGGTPVYKTDSEGNIQKNSDGNPIVSYYDQGVGATTDITGKNDGKQIEYWCYQDYYYQKIQ